MMCPLFFVSVYKEMSTCKLHKKVFAQCALLYLSTTDQSSTGWLVVEYLGFVNIDLEHWHEHESEGETHSMLGPFGLVLDRRPRERGGRVWHGGGGSGAPKVSKVAPIRFPRSVWVSGDTGEGNTNAFLQLFPLLVRMTLVVSLEPWKMFPLFADQIWRAGSSSPSNSKTQSHLFFHFDRIDLADGRWAIGSSLGYAAILYVHWHHWGKQGCVNSPEWAKMRGTPVRLRILSEYPHV